MALGRGPCEKGGKGQGPQNIGPVCSDPPDCVSTAGRGLCTEYVVSQAAARGLEPGAGSHWRDAGGLLGGRAGPVGAPLGRRGASSRFWV